MLLKRCSLFGFASISTVQNGVGLGHQKQISGRLSSSTLTNLNKDCSANGTTIKDHIMSAVSRKTNKNKVIQVLALKKLQYSSINLMSVLAATSRPNNEDRK